MACCENNKNIKNACAGNRGTATDVTKVYIACEDDVTAIPAASAHVISTNITMAEDKTFFQWDIDPVGSSWKIDTIGDGQAQEYEFTGIYRIVGVAPAETYALDSLIKGNALFIQKDKNAHKMLVGALDDGATVKVAAANSPNAYTITVSYKGPHMPYFYTGTITIAEDV